ncbi:hypothetical protein [Extensimonas vulgaris]|nr:hypothetical protein [Extensimonas vulgaris]
MSSLLFSCIARNAGTPPHLRCNAARHQRLTYRAARSLEAQP